MSHHTPSRSQIGSVALARYWARLGYPVFGVAQTLDADGRWRKAPAFSTSPDASLVADPLPYLRRIGGHNGGYHQSTLDADSVPAVVSASTLVATPGPADVLVIDVDDPERFDGLGLGEVWTEYERRTLVVASRWPDRERRHVYVRVPAGEQVHTRQVPGGEVCGHFTRDGRKGSYWILPGQERPDCKGEYVVMSGSPDGIPVADPRIVEALHRAGARAAPDARPVCLRPSTFTDSDDDGEPVTAGGRNDFLFRRGCALADRCHDRDVVAEYVAALNAARCRPQHDAAEVDRVVESVMRRTAPVPAPKEAAPAPNPAASKKEAARYDYTRDRLAAALAACGIEVARMMPRDQPAVRFGAAGEWELLHRREPRSRIICELRERCQDKSGQPYYIRQNRLFDALLDEVARRKTVDVPADVDPDHAALEACISALQPGSYRVEDIVSAAGLRNLPEAAARAASLPHLARMVRTVLKQHKFIACDPSTIWTELRWEKGSHTWQSEVSHGQRCRVWRSPAGWLAQGGPLLRLVSTVDSRVRA